METQHSDMDNEMKRCRDAALSSRVIVEPVTPINDDDYRTKEIAKVVRNGKEIALDSSIYLGPGKTAILWIAENQLLRKRLDFPFCLSFFYFHQTTVSFMARGRRHENVMFLEGNSITKFPASTLASDILMKLLCCGEEVYEITSYTVTSPLSNQHPDGVLFAIVQNRTRFSISFFVYGSGAAEKFAVEQ
ncbi:hypothetical protein BWQ96_00716 [Gracilariopsis chorda]|uniref:Uncharacterized protein n=1 Tax=Gracilariopsis chorda TaxID=448386 RepID=A0A2V3J8H9_9FLOR|nr:hypothetical protein BWQ96_00716 [Gracilariopsis chorda]|eukprot:PXF49400.1 hypothetical protein BWQ96_00716 [Gracilariopsis chorda]